MLRDYQVLAIEQARAAYRAGHRRVLLHMATGGGKTATFCEVLKSAHEKGTFALVVVRGRKLIDQASARLTREGVPHGIIMAGRSSAIHHRIRVCSIDTLYARRTTPQATLLVIDEAHQTSGDGYEWFLGNYPNAKILAVTATPHLKGGMRHVADTVVYPITAKELTERGYLVPLQYWAPETPDLTSVTTSAGDYNQKQLGKAMRLAALSGNVVETYKKHAMGTKAVLFAVDVEHSLQLVQQFTDAGISAEHVDANCTDAERFAAIERLLSGTTHVISNVGILTTGVDIPALQTIIMCRPTKSYNLWIQMIGRGTRPFEGKTHCAVFDHAGNVDKHGFLEDEIECSLDGKKPSKPQETRTCKSCYAVFSTAIRECPRCGTLHVVPAKSGKRKTDIDENVELAPVDTSAARWEIEYQKLVAIARKRNLKQGFVWHTIKEKFGPHAASAAKRLLKQETPWFDQAKRDAEVAQKNILSW